MKRLVLLSVAVVACGREALRADAAPTADFPSTWAGTKAPAHADPAPVRQAVASTPPPRQAQPAVARAAVRGLVAVLDFSNKLKGSDRDQLDGAYFANQVRAEVKRRFPALGVMTRENILVLLQSGGKTLADCEGECEVDTGRRLGADYVISGDMLKVGTKYKLDLRLHDTHDGQLLSGATGSGATADDLDANIAAAIDELVRPLR